MLRLVELVVLLGSAGCTASSVVVAAAAKISAAGYPRQPSARKASSSAPTNRSTRGTCAL